MIVKSKNYQIRAGKIEKCFAQTAVFTIRRINRPLLKLIPTQIHVNTVNFISILLQKRWALWETRLQPVAWFIVSTAIVQSPQPSTLRTTPRLGNSGTRTFSSPISTATTPWQTTTPEKECCTPGTTRIWSLIASPLTKIRFVM